jgi:nucleoside 2-deoxyribosyltransferase
MSGSRGKDRAQTPQPLRAYLAGPDVFLNNAARLARCKERLCAEHGMIGVSPGDNGKGVSQRDPATLAREIARTNEALIRGCDLVIANCSPFRGVSMDAGTAFEIGYARALGKPVFGYSNVMSAYKQRVRRYRRLGDPLDADAAHSAIEDFGLADNLMLATALARAMVRTKVPRGGELTDQRAFARCLALAARAMAARPSRRLATRRPGKARPE